MTKDSPLGQKTEYPDQYAPELLFAIPRAPGREQLGLGDPLPFRGVDIWNLWELTWLDSGGKPRVATAEIRVPADSPNIVESKSLKLYCNSFSMSRFAAKSDVESAISTDLGNCTGAEVSVTITPSPDAEGSTTATLPGTCIDLLDVECGQWEVDANLLRADPDTNVKEQLHSHLLRSLCPVTAQPDTGSVLVDYQGPRIDPAALLCYVVSYRQHNDFHEACVERMFLDLKKQCGTEQLTVYARYQRRGGIDINPCRSDRRDDAANLRLWRQ